MNEASTHFRDSRNFVLDMRLHSKYDGPDRHLHKR